MILEGPIVPPEVASFIKFFDPEAMVITAGDVRKALAQYQRDGVGEVEFMINSPGGSYFETSSLVSMVSEWPGTINTTVTGLAASGAGLLTMVTNRVRMSSMAMLMIHQAWSMREGNSQDMHNEAEILEKMDERQMEVISKRSGMDKEEAYSAMQKETWYTATEAVSVGLANEVMAFDQMNKGKHKKDKKKAMIGSEREIWDAAMDRSVAFTMDRLPAFL